MNFVEKLYSDAFEEGFRLAIKYYTLKIERGPVNQLKNKIGKSTAQKIDEQFNSLLEKYSNKPVSKSLLSKKSSYWA